MVKNKLKKLALKILQLRVKNIKKNHDPKIKFDCKKGERIKLVFTLTSKHPMRVICSVRCGRVAL